MKLDLHFPHERLRVGLARPGPPLRVREDVRRDVPQQPRRQHVPDEARDARRRAERLALGRLHGHAGHEQVERREDDDEGQREDDRAEVEHEEAVHVVEAVEEHLVRGRQLQVAEGVEHQQHGNDVSVDVTLLKASKSKTSKSSKILFEISGGINYQNINLYSNLGSDFISSSKITNSAKSVDIGLDII